MDTLLARRSAWALAAIAAATSAFGLWAVLHPARAAEEARGRHDQGPVAVTTAPVRQQDMPIYRSGIGTVTPMVSVTVKARVDGQLDEVAFAEGQDVKKGQLLARLDPRTLQAQLLQAQAARAKDQATLANARADLKRYQTLIAQDAVTQQQLDTQQALVNQLAASVKADDAAVNAAQVQLGFSTITAPIGGRAGARLVDPGNIVHAGDAAGLVVINQIDPISVAFTLPDDAVQETIRALDANKPVVVQAFARDGGQLLATGTLTLLNNQIDTASGTVQLKAGFPNGAHRLWPGQYVDVRLVLGTREKALTVPERAVQRGQDGVYVYVVDAPTQTVRSRQLVLAQVQDGVAVVASGLEAGARVVVDGQYKLKPGARVTEVAAAAPAAASGARR